MHLMQSGLKLKNKKFISCLVLLTFMCSFIWMALPGSAGADPFHDSDAATSLTIKVGYTSTSNPTTTYTTVRTFTYEEMDAMANVQQAYSYVDSMPAPVIDAARGILISDLLTAAGIDTGANMSNVNKIYFYCTDINGVPYMNLTNSYLYDSPRYYYPNIVKSWNYDTEKPDQSGSWGSPTDAAVQVYPILAVEDNWARFQDPPDFNNMSNATRYRLLNGQMESDYTNGVYTAAKSAKWVCEIDVMLNQAAPPALTSDSSDNSVGQAVTLTFTDDAAWRAAIRGVTVDGSAVDSEKYSVAEGTITIDQSVFATAKDYAIAVQATGYSDASVTQSMNTASTNTWDGSIDVTWYNTTDTVFYIDTPAKLAGLAAIVNGIYNTGAAVTGNPAYIVTNVGGGDVAGPTDATWIYGADDFDGKTVYLTADLDMGGVYDSAAQTWSGPNYMPIGGQYCMTYQDGTTLIGSSWNGAFDGQGHTVKNIYCSRHAGSLGYSMSQSVGLIGRMGVHDNDPVGWYASPSVKNVAVTGYIYGNRSIGGIVGKNGRSNGSVIENCINYASVRNTDSKGVGGIAGAGWNKLTIKNCANMGNIYTSYSNAGGISGSCEAKVYNSYNVGYVGASSANQAQSLGTNNGGAVWTNCYWLDGSSASNQAVYGSTTGSTITQMMTPESMKTADFLADLNGDGHNWVADTNSINSGYPVPRGWGADSATVTSVTKESDPNKLNYVVGQTFDPDGLVIWANYSDGIREQVTDYIISKTTPLATTDTLITVSGMFGGIAYSFDFPITVEANVEPISAPVLSADTTGNDIGQPVEITFTDYTNWVSAIIGVSVNGTPLAAEQYTVSPGQISIAAEVFTQAGAYAVAVQAAGYNDATVTQTMNGGIEFTYTITNGQAVISSYTGSASEITVPGIITHDGIAYPTTIANGVFTNRTELTSVTLLDGLTSIGGSAFKGCSGLTSVTFPDSLTSIENYAFRDCTGLSSVTIPAGVTNIGTYVFRDCSNLEAAYFLGSYSTFNSNVFNGTASTFQVYYHISQAASWSGYANYPNQAFCVLTLDLQDGSAPESSYAVVTDGHIAAPAEPIREGYTFGGWYKEAACTNAFDFSSETVTGDVTLYAKWTVIPADNPKYTVTTVEDVSVYEVGETGGIKTMTVKTGVTGLKYFVTLVTPVIEHGGEEAVVFTHLRDGVQLSLNVTKADFDLVGEAQSGFNVKAGDMVKVFIVDDLTNDVDHNPTLLL